MARMWEGFKRMMTAPQSEPRCSTCGGVLIFGLEHTCNLRNAIKIGIEEHNKEYHG